MLNRTFPPAIKDAVNFSFHLPACNRMILKNGIPLYWLNAGTQDVIQIEWVFRAGLWQEPATGIAQAFAALLKNGTRKRSAIQINEALEFYGASLKISATNDFHTISLHTLTRHLSVLLPVIQEMILEATFPQEELDIYVQNAIQRLKVNLEKTEFVSNRNSDAFLFGMHHPYGRFTTREDLLAMEREQLRTFYRQYFKSENCRIFIAGKVASLELELVNQFFGEEKWGAVTNSEIFHFEPQPSSQKRHRMQIGSERNIQGSVRLNCAFPVRSHPDFVPMILVNILFGGYFGSRLMANIREDKGYTYGIYSHILSFREGSALMIATEAGSEVCEATIQEIYKEMETLCQHLVSDEELLLVKNYLLGNLLGDLDGPFSIMQRWKSIILFDLPEDSFERNIQIYKNISATEIRELANKYFQKENFYELIVV